MYTSDCDNSNKVNVSVFAKHDEDGNIVPSSIIWEDGRLYYVDRILSVVKASSLKSGGEGVRYEFEIEGQKRFIWLDGTRWFIKRK